MKRFLITTLTIALVLSCLGHTFAATFCSRGMGMDCCTRTASPQMPDAPSPDKHAHCMNGMTMPDAPADGRAMGMVKDGMARGVETNSSSSDVSPRKSLREHLGKPDLFSSLVPEVFTLKATSQISPVGCAHCLTHAGIANAPLSVAGVTDEGKDFGVILLPSTKSIFGSAIPYDLRVLPREHAPPPPASARHLLINVFLI